MNFHENYERKTTVKSDSDRRFGFVFAFIFAVLGILSLYKGSDFYLLLIPVSFSLFFVSLVVPKALNTPKRLWLKFGELLHQLISPIILLVLFYIVFCPTAYLLRLFKKDLLDVRLDKNSTSVWHHASESPLTSMKDQF